MPQYEKDNSESIARMKERLGIEGGIFSGGQMHNFRRGWAKAAFTSGERAHYFIRSTRNIGRVVALCGAKGVAGQLFGPGNYPKCKNCAKHPQSYRSNE